jgi:hypothetical protein
LFFVLWQGQGLFCSPHRPLRPWSPLCVLCSSKFCSHTFM